MLPDRLYICFHGPNGNAAPKSVLDALPTSQGGSGRHKCVVCAYAAGFDDAVSGVVYTSQELEICTHVNPLSKAPTAVLENLPISQGGIGRHKCTTCAYQQGFDAGKCASTIASNTLNTQLAVYGDTAENGESDDDFTPQSEGKKKTRTQTYYERSGINRARAIDIHGTACSVCGFDFDDKYGEEYAGHYIEIHHVESVASLGGKVVDPKTDLVPLCSNCHSMAHRQPGKIATVEELRKLIKDAEAQKNP